MRGSQSKPVSDYMSRKSRDDVEYIFVISRIWHVPLVSPADALAERKSRQLKGRRSKAEDIRDPWWVACSCAAAGTQPPASDRSRTSWLSCCDNGVF
jgi:hypothetical protein